MLFKIVCSRAILGFGGQLVAAALMAGCSGESIASLQTSGNAGDAAAAQRLGGAPGSVLRSLPAQTHRRAALGIAVTTMKSIPRDLYVSDLGVLGIIVFRNRTYKELGTITNGTYGPDGLWVDRHGNLYAANFDGGNVTEYAPGASSPNCSYSGLADPINVTTDRKGNVFVSDWNSGSNGAIVKYKQCKDAIVKRYSFDSYSAPEAAAVDDSGNLFIAYYAANAPPSSQGGFEEFPAGSNTPKQLGATIIFPGGMILDKNDDLIAADQGYAGAGNGAVDVIAPPYDNAAPISSQLAQPFHLSLNKKESLLFVTSLDFSVPTVWVMKYPSGNIKTTLGASNGLAYPLGVADSPH